MARKKESPKPKSGAPSLAAFAELAAHPEATAPAPVAPAEAPMEESLATAAKAFHVDLKKAAPVEAAPAENPEIFLCPNCGAFIDPKAESCEHCGIAFADGQAPPEPAPEGSAPPEAPPAEAPPKGKKAPARKKPAKAPAKQARKKR